MRLGLIKEGAVLDQNEAFNVVYFTEIFSQALNPPSF